ncbi:MAG: P1 family peptidase [Vicinamibacteria bacterium]
MSRCLLAVFIVASALPALAAEPRGRDLGIPFDFGVPGRWNAITDVAGVEVGHETLIEGDSVRTGVTAILPRGRGPAARNLCFAGHYILNGAGEMTGLQWVDESGFLDSPIVLTNTNSVGVVRDAVIQWAAEQFPPKGGDWTIWSQPVVAETWDGELSDIYGMHVKAEHLRKAFAAAKTGPVMEGSVGGGTGMICYEFKGGIGTASRVLLAAKGGYTLGVLVQANHGLRHQLRIAGLPVGLELNDGLSRDRDSGSIIIVVATDAPLLPHQLKRLARRAALGLARTGSVAGNDSGDLFIAFSTANPQAVDQVGPAPLTALPNLGMAPLFEATVGATEEAIINALVAGRTMKGFHGTTVAGLPHDRVRSILKRHGRLAE